MDRQVRNKEMLAPQSNILNKNKKRNWLCIHYNILHAANFSFAGNELKKINKQSYKEIYIIIAISVQILHWITVPLLHPLTFFHL